MSTTVGRRGAVFEAIDRFIPGSRSARSDDSDRIGRLGRLGVVTGFVLLYVAIGIAFGVDPNGYLMLGIPLTIAFQVVIARRPIRALWLADARPFRLDRPGVALALGLAVVPLILFVVSVANRDLGAAAYGVAALAGAGPAAYSVRAMNPTAWRALIRSFLTAGLLGSGLFVLFAVASRGADTFADPAGMLRTGVFSFLQYLPIVFVIEEVLFRGALDPYARGPLPARDRTSAILVSALWGLWHLPITFPTSGLAQLPILLVFHTVLGVLLTSGWRRSGNLAVPGVTHALTDAIRNAFIAI